MAFRKSLCNASFFDIFFEWYVCNFLPLNYNYDINILKWSFTAVQGSVEHGTQTKLSLIYEHTLQRHAFGLIIGKFGGIQGNIFLWNFDIIYT